MREWTYAKKCIPACGNSEYFDKNGKAVKRTSLLAPDKIDCLRISVSPIGNKIFVKGILFELDVIIYARSCKLNLVIIYPQLKRIRIPK